MRKTTFIHLLSIISSFLAFNTLHGQPENRKGYFFTDISLLYWAATADNLEYGAKNVTEIVVPDPPKVIDTKFDYFSPGTA